MLNIDSYSQILNRIKNSFAFQNIDEVDMELLHLHQGSYRLLLKEMARRIYLWSEYLHLDKRVLVTGCFPKLSQNINAKWEVDAYRNRELNEILRKDGFFKYYFPFGISELLSWETNKQEYQIQKTGLPMPYEPFLRFMERGGQIYKIDGNGVRPFFAYFGQTFEYRVRISPILEVLQEEPYLESLEDVYLDEIDEAFQREGLTKRFE